MIGAEASAAEGGTTERPAPRRGCRFEAAEDAAIRAAYAEDRTLAEIAQALGRTAKSIAMRAGALGLTDRSRGGRIAARLLGPEGCRARGFAAMAALMRQGHRLNGAVPFAPGGDPPWYRTARELRRAGMKIEAIALTVRRSTKRVSLVCRGVGVQRAHRRVSVCLAASMPQPAALPCGEATKTIPEGARR